MPHGRRHRRNHPRARRILESGNTRAFDVFDRGGHKNEIRGKSIEQLLDEFARERGKNIDDLRGLNLSETDLKKPGLHPGLGAVTMSQLLATWAAHDLTHLHQIARVMARQYQGSVGPFAKFLGVMHCQGHGS